MVNILRGWRKRAGEYLGNGWLGSVKKYLAYRFGSLGRRVRGPVLKIHSRFESRHLCREGQGGNG